MRMASLLQHPTPSGRNGGPENRPARCLRLWGCGHPKVGDVPLPIAKDITTARLAAAERVRNAVEYLVAADADNALLDRVHCATLDGTRNCRSVAPNALTRRRTPRNNPAVGSAEPRNLWEFLLGAGPRTRSEVLRLRGADGNIPAERSMESAADTAGTAHGDGPSPARSYARCGLPAGAANAEPHGGRRRCSSGFVGDWVDKTARIP
jgi:hypothetical protein